MVTEGPILEEIFGCFQLVNFCTTSLQLLLCTIEMKVFKDIMLDIPKIFNGTFIDFINFNCLEENVIII